MKEMQNSVKITLIIVLAVIALALIGTYTVFQIIPVTSNTVVGNGMSDIKVTPDLVTVYFTVQTNATTAKDAKDKNAEIVDNVITNLVKQGFERADIQTQNFNIYQDYYWDGSKSVPNGYKATHEIKVELPTAQTDKIGDVIDAGVNAGATINYINFELTTEKQNQYKTQALKQATEDAKAKADAMASGLGKSLGKVISITDSNFNYNPWPIYRNDVMAYGATGAVEAKSAATNIQPGSQDITAQVSVVYALK